MGGLLLSQFLTLYTTPVIYLYLDRLGIRARRWRQAAHLPGMEDVSPAPALSNESTV